MERSASGVHPRDGAEPVEVGSTTARVGQRFGRYRLYDEIGAGGMASVHVARLLGPVGFCRTVAVKRLRGDLLEDPELFTMFLDEARLAARIQHPNVVQVLDVVPEGKEVLLVMEYVKGDSLARLLRVRDTRVPLPVTLAILTDVLHGLHAAHEATSETGARLRIVHRDVSPQNVLVGSDGIARVSDFGIAKAAGRAHSTRDGRLRGKLSYMAPEQVRRGRLDQRTDIFATSVVAWEMLTGVRLFVGDDAGGILHQILHEPVPWPHERAEGVSGELAAIVMKGLERNPDARFGTAQEMARALEELGPARHTEVASWVEATIGDLLRERAERVRAIERASAMADEPSATEPAPATAGARAVRAADVPTAPVGWLAPPPRVDEQGQGERTGVEAVVDCGAADTATVDLAPRTSRRPVLLAIAAVGLGALVLVLVWTRGGGVARPPGSDGDVSPAASAVPAPSAEASAPAIVPPPSAEAAAAVSADQEPSRSSAPRPARGKPRDNCNPPYVIDARGIRVYKRACLNR